MSSVNISSTFSQVKIYFKSGKIKEWNFYSKRDSKRYEMENTTEGTDMTIETGTSSKVLHFAKISKISFGCDSNCIEDVVGFIKHISTIHNAPVHFLEIHPSKLHHLEAIQSVDVLRKSKNVKINGGTVSHEEMRRILEGFENAALEIHCNPDPGLTYDRQISIRDLRIKNGFWFKGPMLLNIDCEKCETVRVNNTELAQEHINRLLHEWVDNTTGGKKYLRVCAEPPASDSVYHDSRPPIWDSANIVQGLSRFEKQFQSPSHKNLRVFRREIGGILFVAIFPEIPGCIIRIENNSIS